MTDHGDHYASLPTRRGLPEKPSDSTRSSRSSTENDRALLPLSKRSTLPEGEVEISSLIKPGDSVNSHKDWSNLTFRSRRLRPPLQRGSPLQPKVFRVTSDSFLVSSSKTLRSIRPKFFCKFEQKDVCPVNVLPQLDGESEDTITIVVQRSDLSLPDDQLQAVSTPETQPHKRADSDETWNPADVTPQLMDTPITPFTTPAPDGSFPFFERDDLPSPLTPFSARQLGSPLRPSQRTPRLTPNSRSFTPSQTPDRFLPIRRPGSVRESYEMNRSPERLSDTERKSRTADVTIDPFAGRLRTNATRLITRFRSQTTPSQVPGSARLVRSVRRNSAGSSARSFSPGAIWNVGGMNSASIDSLSRVPDGRGGYMTSGSTAPLYSATFFTESDPASERDMHQRRLALALDMDLSERILSSSSTPTSSSSISQNSDSPVSAPGKLLWRNGTWHREGATIQLSKQAQKKRAVPTIPFRVLDAPALRDDFYCSLLAYSHDAKLLAVGLGNTVYFWNESGGVESPAALNPGSSAYVSSLSFSSKAGGQAILAVGRSDGHIILYSPFDSEPRFNSRQPSSVCCVAFRPTTVKRPSRRDPDITVETEELLVGDESGHVYLYSVEWPNSIERDVFDWSGCLSLLCRITVHTQQICGIAWSPDGNSFATGGNDNLCHLFDTRRVLAEASTDAADVHSSSTSSFTPHQRNIDLSSPTFNISALFAKHCFTVAAAVKAIAFCPWQRGLLAIGGGSNDRRIHFFHTLSGATLATIDCHAQITSLVWSTTRREIAATFGFAQPDHPYRIAVFKWPSCEIVVKIPWMDEHRALFAIAYPGGPNGSLEKDEREDEEARRGARGRARARSAAARARSLRSRDQRREGGIWWSRTEEEGCLVVATSDSSIKFHEVWAEERKATGERGGLLGGSPILDLIHRIDRDDGEVIR